MLGQDGELGRISCAGVPLKTTSRICFKYARTISVTFYAYLYGATVTEPYAYMHTVTQSLMGDIQSITYQTFRHDPVKYPNYEEVRNFVFVTVPPTFKVVVHRPDWLENNKAVHRAL